MNLERAKNLIDDLKQVESTSVRKNSHPLLSKFKTMIAVAGVSCLVVAGFQASANAQNYPNYPYQSGNSAQFQTLIPGAAPSQNIYQRAQTNGTVPLQQTFQTASRQFDSAVQNYIGSLTQTNDPQKRVQAVRNLTSNIQYQVELAKEALVSFPQQDKGLSVTYQNDLVRLLQSMLEVNRTQDLSPFTTQLNLALVDRQQIQGALNNNFSSGYRR